MFQVFSFEKCLAFPFHKNFEKTDRALLKNHVQNLVPFLNCSQSKTIPAPRRDEKYFSI